MAASEDATLAFGTGLLAHPMTPTIPTADDTTAAQFEIDFMTLSFLFVGSFVRGTDGARRKRSSAGTSRSGSENDEYRRGADERDEQAPEIEAGDAILAKKMK